MNRIKGRKKPLFLLENEGKIIETGTVGITIGPMEMEVPVKKGAKIKREKIFPNVIQPKEMKQNYYKERAELIENAKKQMKKLGFKMPKKSYALEDLTSRDLITVTEGPYRHKIEGGYDSREMGGMTVNSFKEGILTKKKKQITQKMMISLGNPEERMPREAISFITYHEIAEANVGDEIIRYVNKNYRKKPIQEITNWIDSLQETGHLAANSIAFEMLKRANPQAVQELKKMTATKTSPFIEKYIQEEGLEKTMQKFREDPSFFHMKILEEKGAKYGPEKNFIMYDKEGTIDPKEIDESRRKRFQMMREQRKERKLKGY